MKNLSGKYFCCLVSLFLILNQGVMAQDKERSNEEHAEIESIEKAIEKNPDDLTLHDKYSKATGFTKWNAPEDPAFIQQYKNWMQRFPTSAAIPYALGHAFAGKESPKAKPYLLNALELDPSFDKAYYDLWIDAERWGQFEKGREYIGKASKMKPDNADYAFYYASSFSKTDVDKYIRLSLEVAETFPESERGAQALYWLATRNKDLDKRLRYYEILLNKYSPAKFRWSSSGMGGYYDVLLQQDPKKALELAKMLSGKLTDSSQVLTWQKNVSIAENINESKNLMAKGKFQEASALLDSVSLGRYSDAKNYLLLLKSQALKGLGKAKDAYQQLIASYVKSPEKDIGDALFLYGNAIGKSSETVKNEIWKLRDTKAVQATPFKLKKYFSEGFTSLDDFKGKVVLLTYWFPGCGPCRGEFPHFQNVVDKFDEKDLAYVGINIVPDQNEYVIPFMEHSGYTFIPLEDTPGREKGNLDNRGAAPVNFLIDQNGKIMFTDIRTHEQNEDVLETMIQSLIKR